MAYVPVDRYELIRFYIWSQTNPDHLPHCLYRYRLPVPRLTEIECSFIGTFLTFDPGPLAPYPTWFVSLSLDGRAYIGLGWRSSFVTVHLGEVPVIVWASRAQVLA